ncbi:Atp-dependent rna helicase deah12, chloroplastic [Heracleum sosnowskyi]|uniref:RBR-type E3 ubiquitin transferase n=1 Tax=Heracleum sosnowskyi TaxID=360622 RepID=A0AAD8M2W3_9APIA|nr:Atp-dependent rna helicase deah12, chloroplastic [Heracleum sosnowskyi]
MEVDDELYALLSEQRRELVAAVSSESDHDLAFKLQMEEAFNASLASQPSSSSYDAKPQRFDVPDENDVGIAKLLAEEIDKFERERSDREHVDAEMKRVRDELGRTIHDRAFAREVVAVPEVQWNNSGDYYHKPYESEKSEKISSEDFRVYCKGLVSEKKVLAGIGVAICDSSGEIVVFKMRKPLVLEEMSGEIAEMKALIEGLNAAVTLGLKRIMVFCDGVEIYQIVTGQRIAKPGNMEILADELTLLQRKFTRCLPHLVEKKNVQFAVGLARDAIIAQVTWPGESSGNIKKTEACIICLEDRAVTQMLVVDGCQHRYCSSCLKQHSQAKLSQGMLPRCPHEGCKSDLKFEYCRKFLPREALDLMSQRIKEATVPVTEKVYCPFPRCSTLMSKSEVCAVNNAGGSRCTNCHDLFCINCKVPWHSNMSCSQYKNLHPYPSSEEVKLKTLATKKQWRQCGKCNNMIELKEGCNHIFCRCGHQFCYTCGAEWKNKQATCKCAIWDEHRIVYPARNRR